MRVLSRRLTAVALLPLLIWTLSGWCRPGGWYCASGSRCQPAIAFNCCCRTHTAAPDDCCAGDGREHQESLSSLACGCYYHAQGLHARVQPAEDLLSHAAAPPASAPVLLAPPVRSVSVARPPDTRGPPRLLVSSRLTRGPPAV